MGFLDGLFGSKLANPALATALQAYSQDGTDEVIVDLWQKFLKTKVILLGPADTRSAFGKCKQIRDAASLQFNSRTNEKGEMLLCVFIDREAADQATTSQTIISATGEQAYNLACVKGLNGLVLHSKDHAPVEIRCWQHVVFVEKLADANKLQTMATRHTRTGCHADAEAILKSAISAAQRDPGPQHPYTGELNLELARSLRTQNKLTEAEWVYRRALSIYEISGSHDLDVAATSEALGTLYIENKKASQATPLLTRALEIYENVPGAKPDSIARILCQLAELKREENKGADAEGFYKRATLVLEERKHPDVLQVFNKLGALYESEARGRDALASYLRSISLGETIKRCRELDIAHAAARAAAIHVDEQQFGEAQTLAQKALDIFMHEHNVAETEKCHALLQVIAEALEEQERIKAEDEKGRPRFGTGARRPTDLPLLDMSELRSNAKAAYAPGSDSGNKEKNKEEASAADPEEEALAQMRAFLNAVQTDDAPAAKANADETVANTASVEASSEEDTPVAEESLDVDELFASTKKTAEDRQHSEHAPDVVSPAEDSGPLPEADDSDDNGTSAADKLFSRPVDGAISGAFSKSLLSEGPKDDRYDLPISQRKAVSPPPAPPAPPGPPPKPAAATASAGHLYDTPISERRAAATTQEPPQAQPAAAAVVETPTPPAEKKGLFDARVSGEISQIFDASVLNEINKSDRYDRPISERLACQTKTAEPESEVAAEKKDSTLFDDDALDGSLDAAFASIVSDPKVAQDKLESAPEPEKPVSKTASLFDDDALDGSLDQAFASIVCDPKVAQDKVESPASGNANEEVQEARTEPAPVAAQTKSNESNKSNAAHDADLSTCKSPQELIELLESKLNKEPDNSELWLRKGTALVQLQRLDEAIKVFDKVTTMCPDDSKAWYCKGSSLHLKSRFEDALYCFNHVLNLEQDNAKAMLRKAECLSKLGRPEQSMHIYERLLVVQPNFVPGWLSKGRALLQQRKLEEAHECYTEALAIDPGNEEALKARNLIATKLGANANNN